MQNTIGIGKTSYDLAEICYDFYINMKASKLANMKRIPRKLKKRYFKNQGIKKTYKELKVFSHDLHTYLNK